MMKVVILCGGFGTRIRDVAEDVPKPMIPIGGRPILWHIMRYYAEWGFRDFVLCLGYKGQVIKDYFLNYRAHVSDFTLCLGAEHAVTYHSQPEPMDWSITFAETGLDAMTGARVARIAKYVGDEPFMLTYGDGVGNVDLDALLACHSEHGRVMTVTGVRPPGRFGELEINRNSEIVAFNEKPQVSGGRISGGFFVCNSRIFEYLSTDSGVVLEREPMRRLAEDRQMMVFRHDGFWQPMDTHRDHSLLSSLWQEGKAPWKIWE